MRALFFFEHPLSRAVYTCITLFILLYCHNYCKSVAFGVAIYCSFFSLSKREGERTSRPRTREFSYTNIAWPAATRELQPEEPGVAGFFFQFSSTMGVCSWVIFWFDIESSASSWYGEHF